MAERLDSFEFKNVSRTRKPWSEWLDGTIWRLRTADFGDIKLSTVATQARVQAAKRGKKIRISVDEKAGTIVLQASEMTEEEKATTAKKLSTAKANEKAKRIAKKLASLSHAQDREEDLQEAKEQQEAEQEEAKEEPKQPSRGRRGRK